MFRIALTAIRRAVTIALAISTLVPGVSLACSACFAVTGGHGLTAYYISTILLSAMPFLLIGLIAAVAYSVRRSGSTLERKL